jgi:hypothetical protein
MTLTLGKSIRNFVLLLAPCCAFVAWGWAAGAQEIIKQTPTTVFPIKDHTLRQLHARQQSCSDRRH